MSHCFIFFCDPDFLKQDEAETKILKIFLEDILRLTKGENENLFAAISQLKETSEENFLKNLSQKVRYQILSDKTLVFILDIDFSFSPGDESEDFLDF